MVRQTHPEERRKRRSSNVIVALRYWLVATARRTRTSGLTLADASGFLIASNLPKGHAEELATLAPLLVRPDASGQRPVDCYELPLSIHEIPLFDSKLLLCAAGDACFREQGLREAVPGVLRIIKELVSSWSRSMLQ
jgi:hypothetical protein